MSQASESLPLTLTVPEVEEITGYRLPSCQLRVLTEMGIPAHRRPDNTVMVLRVYATTRPASEASPQKQEPQLRMIRTR